MHWMSIPHTSTLRPHEPIHRITVPKARCLGTSVRDALPVGTRFFEGFIDQDDGNLDVSDWLVDRKGFLPIPIVITEPAVGYGGGLALMFVRNSMRESAEKSKATGHQTPPDIFVLGAAATENGTKFAFGGGMATFGDDDR